MSKIKFMTDSACDIPDEDLRRLNIDMLSIPFVIDGMEFYERESFVFEEYYQILGRVEEIPKTSRISQMVYLDCYEKNYVMGFEHLINVTISSTGSGTITSAMLAREEFYQKHPEAKETFQIHVIDSLCYSLGYGWAVMEGAKMAQDGYTIHQILHYLENWFATVDIYLACYTLDYAKKSGRIGAATAFLGEMLGMRPIIYMKDGKTETAAKVRGDNQVVKGIFQQYKKNYTKEDTILIVCGEDRKPAEELQGILKKERKIVSPIFQAGASIVTNSGPRMLAIVAKPSPLTF